MLHYSSLACCLSLSVASIAFSHPVQAQSSEPSPPIPSTIISISPAELVYKTQLGYEHRWGTRNSLGMLGSYHYGNFSHAGQLRGGQLTGYYRRFLTHEFPTGLYVQAQASLLDFVHTASLVNIETKQAYSFDYQAASGGAGFGFGYRGRIMKRVFNNHLLYNAMLGVRFQHLPAADYDATKYRPETGFLGQTDDANWHLGFGPGSLAHGLLTLDYEF